MIKVLVVEGPRELGRKEGSKKRRGRKEKGVLHHADHILPHRKPLLYLQAEKKLRLFTKNRKKRSREFCAWERKFDQPEIVRHISKKKNMFLNSFSTY